MSLLVRGLKRKGDVQVPRARPRSLQCTLPPPGGSAAPLLLPGQHQLGRWLMPSVLPGSSHLSLASSLFTPPPSFLGHG